MIRYTPLLLLLTIPFFGGTPLLGIPLWAWVSMGTTLFYAVVLILVIERKWDYFSGQNDA